MRFYITTDDVLKFNATWPCSKIEVRRHIVEIDDSSVNGDIIDHDFTEDEDGPEVNAIIDDVIAKRWKKLYK